MSDQKDDWFHVVAASEGYPPDYIDALRLDLALKSTPVVCLDCGWKGLDCNLLAQACPVCDGRVKDV